jgi:hypothetical protein
VDNVKALRMIRGLLAFFMLALIVSGITAFPLTFEVNILDKTMGNGSFVESIWPAMAHWISTVSNALNEVDANFPFLFYGTDWLAFAHIIIAISFIGPIRDPIKNIWGVEFGMIACVLLIPLAIIFGPIRGLPLFWILIDCSFGVFGIVPLLIAYRLIKQVIKFEKIAVIA